MQIPKITVINEVRPRKQREQFKDIKSMNTKHLTKKSIKDLTLSLKKL